MNIPGVKKILKKLNYNPVALCGENECEFKLNKLRLQFVSQKDSLLVSINDSIRKIEIQQFSHNIYIAMYIKTVLETINMPLDFIEFKNIETNRRCGDDWYINPTLDAVEEGLSLELLALIYKAGNDYEGNINEAIDKAIGTEFEEICRIRGIV